MSLVVYTYAVENVNGMALKFAAGGPEGDVTR